MAQDNNAQQQANLAQQLKDLNADFFTHYTKELYNSIASYHFLSTQLPLISSEGDFAVNTQMVGSVSKAIAQCAPLYAASFISLWNDEVIPLLEKRASSVAGGKTSDIGTSRIYGT